MRLLLAALIVCLVASAADAQVIVSDGSTGWTQSTSRTYGSYGLGYGYGGSVTTFTPHAPRYTPAPCEPLIVKNPFYIRDASRRAMALAFKVLNKEQKEDFKSRLLFMNDDYRAEFRKWIIDNEPTAEQLLEQLEIAEAAKLLDEGAFK